MRNRFLSNEYKKSLEKGTMLNSRVLFTELSKDSLVEGKAFDGMVAGTFTDMLGRKFEFKEEELSEYVENTQVVIDATKTESGELVGLPIDVYDHEKDEAAGWIVGIELINGIVRLTPKWTKLGKELIGESIRRFFSGTFDIARKVIQGGTLTNWPATRDFESGEILLRPIELSQGIFELEVSMDDEVQKIQQAWWEGEELRSGPRSYIADGGIFDDYVIIERSDGNFRVPYETSEEGVIVFASPEEWVAVEKAWIEAAKEYLQQAAKTFWDGLFSRSRNEEKNDIDNEGDVIMIKLEELSKEDHAQLVQEVAVQLVAGANGGEPEAGSAGQTIVELIEKRADEKVALMAAQALEESEIAEFSKGAVSGTDENPVGIPVTEDEIKAFMSMLTPEAREKAKEIFSKILAEGLVEFSETGHGRRLKGVAKLDPKMAGILKAFLSENEENTVETWFEMNAVDVGVMSDYDLAEFVDKKEV